MLKTIYFLIRKLSNAKVNIKQSEFGEISSYYSYDRVSPSGEVIDTNCSIIKKYPQ